MDVKDISKNRRQELGLTLEDVAKAVGVSVSTISRWESGDIENMRRDKIAALAKVLRISPSVIMGWDDSAQNYYLDQDAASYAEFLHDNPDYRVLFDAARNVRPEDIDMVRKLIDVYGKNDD